MELILDFDRFCRRFRSLLNVFISQFETSFESFGHGRLLLQSRLLQSFNRSFMRTSIPDTRCFSVSLLQIWVGFPIKKVTEHKQQSDYLAWNSLLTFIDLVVASAASTSLTSKWSELITFVFSRLKLLGVWIMFGFSSRVDSVSVLTGRSSWEPTFRTAALFPEVIN